MCDRLAADVSRRNPDEEAPKDAAAYAIYAILSNNAYDPKDHEQLGLPPGWCEVDRTTPLASGFAMVIFQKSSSKEVVVAFRGTDQKRDYPNGLKQLDDCDRELRGVLETYKEHKIVATGHSLGGALALHASFKHEGIDAVAFNSSPIIGQIRSYPRNSRVSIAERGEVLDYLRKIAAANDPVWNHIKQVEFHFQDFSLRQWRFWMNPISQHRIFHLANNLIRFGDPKSAEIKALLQDQCSSSAPPK